MESSVSEIKHPGIVEKVVGNLAIVRIVPRQACSACHSKASCGIAEDADKFVNIHLPTTHRFVPGQEVQVTLRKGSGFNALFLGYVFPLILLVIGVFGFYYTIGSEGFAALASLGLLGIYYGALYAFRGILQTKFTFGIETEE